MRVEMFTAVGVLLYHCSSIDDLRMSRVGLVSEIRAIKKLIT